MAWIPVDQTLPRHRKTLRLTKLLGLRRRETVGLLVDLWCWCVDNAPSGELATIAPDEIAHGIDWRGDAPLLLKALRDSGFLDPDGRVHDWEVWIGRFLEQRRKEADRKRRERNERPPDVPRTEDVDKEAVSAGRPGVRPPDVRGMSAPTVPNHTVQNSTEVPTSPIGDAPAPEAAPEQPEPKRPRANYGQHQRRVIAELESTLLVHGREPMDERLKSIVAGAVRSLLNAGIPIDYVAEQATTLARRSRDRLPWLAEHIRGRWALKREAEWEERHDTIREPNERIRAENDASVARLRELGALPSSPLGNEAKPTSALEECVVLMQLGYPDDELIERFGMNVVTQALERRQRKGKTA